MLLLLRAAQGVTLSGLQAVAMAYLGEEVAPAAVGGAMGLFVAGSGLGGMLGRIFAGITADFGGWRAALAWVGGVSLAAGLFVWRALPPSRHFQPRPLTLRTSLASLAGHLHDPALRRLYALGLLMMGAFVTVYNYITFRLLAPPYELSQGVVGAIFVVYLVGIASSTWMGRLADRRGRGPVLHAALLTTLAGLALTLATPLPAVALGLALFTFGFFGAHAVASGWVSRRARAAKGQASALYLFSFYAGSTLVAPLTGLLWPRFAWPGVTGATAALLLLALLIARTLPSEAHPAIAQEPRTLVMRPSPFRRRPTATPRRRERPPHARPYPPPHPPSTSRLPRRHHGDRQARRCDQGAAAAAGRRGARSREGQDRGACGRCPRRRGIRNPAPTARSGPSSASVRRSARAPTD